MYPDDKASEGSFYILRNNTHTVLNGGISSGATEMTLGSSSEFPGKGYVTIGEEAILYTSNDTATSVLSGLTRGADSTTAATHLDGTPVYANFVAAHHNSMKDHLIAIEDDLVDKFSTGVWGFRNRIINGEPRFDQRNGGAGVSVNAASYGYALDRWYMTGHPADGVFSVSRSATTPPPGFNNTMLFTVTTADASIGVTQGYLFSQRVEGANIADFVLGTADAKTFTLSFWVRSSVTGNFSVSFMNGIENRSYPSLYTINQENTWEYKTITVPGDTTGTWSKSTGVSGLTLYWSLGTGANISGPAGSWAGSGYYAATGGTNLISTLNATIEFTGIQLEVGPRATKFEHRPWVVELGLCQRYFEKSYEVDTAIGTVTTTNAFSSPGAPIGATEVDAARIHFGSPKAVNPSISFYTTGGTSGQLVWYSAAGVGTNRVTDAGAIGTSGFTPRQQVNNTDLTAYGHWVASAEL